ncbi:sarcosine oxidase subunit gamma [Advenella mimigardefordensis]|uniref:sarcosine oxidase subunit gamma n=1 Tax=Advenella mimigardefordensis TaxID=302406 RepID=UPI00046CB5FE|nr:sarcosine oxidase subunit gamma family protein [Advenella mimigardefordensis]
MLNDSRQQTPLAGLTGGTRVFELGSPSLVALTEVPFTELVNLRGDPENADLTRAVRNTIGITLTTEPNTTTENDHYCAMWLSPDEWMIRRKGSGVGDLARHLEMALQGIFCAVTDQSSAYSVLQLSGPKARSVLSKGCPLDLHPRVFGAGQCAQSHYYKTSVLLRGLDNGAGDRWEIIVRRSFADYAVRMLVDGMWEYTEGRNR